jgi:hypothetical protein
MPRAFVVSSRRKSNRTWVAAIAAACLSVGAAGLAVGPALGVTGDVTIPLGTTHAAPDVIAANGQDLLKATDLDTEEAFLASTDAGATWINANLPGFTGSSTRFVSDGHVYYQQAVDDGFAIERYDFETNTATQVALLDAEAVSINTTHAVVGQGSDGNGDPTSYASVEFATGTRHTLASSHQGSGPWLGSGAYALVITHREVNGVISAGYIDLLPLSGAKRLSAKVAGLSDASLRGDQVAYLTEKKTGTNVCFRSPMDWAHPACKRVNTGDHRADPASLEVGSDWAIATRVPSDTHAVAFIVKGSAHPTSVAKVVTPAGTTLQLAYASGAAARPIMWLGTSAGGYVASYRSDGTFAHLVDYLPMTATLTDLYLTPAAVVAKDDRPSIMTPGNQVWSRSVTNGVAGPEQLLAPRASGFTGLSASDARTIIRGHSGVALLDGGQLVGKLPNASKVTKLSGPYYLTGRPDGGEVRRIDGTRVLKGPVIDIFGSLALKALSHRRYEVVDVTGRAPVVKGTLPKSAVAGLSGAQVWGDWVMAASTDQFGGDTTVVFNYRKPSQIHTFDGAPIQLGDGFALVDANPGSGTFGLVCWSFATGATEVLVDGGGDANHPVTDGSHQAAWITSTDVVVHQLSGVGTSAPLLLGVIAPKVLNNLPTSTTWKPQFDATKGLSAGSLVIRNAAGVAVRTLASAATKDGSIRSITWNGRAEDGVTPVPAGTYTWELTVPAADGSGNLAVNTLAANAGKPVKGTVRVVSKFLGTVSGSAPKISDKTPVVGQTLTAAPGVWKPASKTTLSYRWFRGGTAVGGNAATYTVTSADLGQRLTVRVTGVADGWRTKTRSSVATAKVAAA